MKNLMLIALMLPMMVLSQKLKLTGVSPSTLCSGDSLTINYQVVPGNNLTFGIKGTEQSQVYQYDLGYLKSQPYQTFNNDTIFSIKVVIHPNMGIGKVDVYTVGTIETLETYVNCKPTGISEILPYTYLKPTYYNLMGNIVEPVPNQKKKKKRGNTIKKVIIIQ